MRPALAVALVLAAGAARAEAPSALEVTLLAVAEASLAADALQTLDIKRHPDRTWDYYGTTLTTRGQYETNFILGAHPSDAKIAVYFTGAALLTGAAWYAIPSRWRVLVPLAVLALQVPQIASNARAGLTLRF